MKVMKKKMFKNEEEYNLAVAKLEEIGDRADFGENEDLIKQFEQLSDWIEAYENDVTDINVGNPIEIIKLKMSYMGLKQKDLQPYIGSSGIVSEVMNKKRALSKNMIRQLSEFLHLEQDLLNVKYELVVSSPKEKKQSSLTVFTESGLFKYISTAQTAFFKKRVSEKGALFAIGC